MLTIQATRWTSSVGHVLPPSPPVSRLDLIGATVMSISLSTDSFEQIAFDSSWSLGGKRSKKRFVWLFESLRATS
jgi:hypothetical protein